MHDLRPIDMILIIAVIAIGGMQAYLFVHVSDSPAPVAGQERSTTGVANEIGLPSPSNILTPIGGEVKAVSAGEIIVTNNGREDRIGIAADTALVRQGERKSDQDFAADMEAFRQQSYELAQNMEKNYDALATLVAPSPFEETTISSADIRPGDFVSAFANSSGDATKVVVIR